MPRSRKAAGTSTGTTVDAIAARARMSGVPADEEQAEVA
jgi:hypothetical protein